MGGYSNWSAADNEKYAGRTGSTNIGAGSAWLSVASQIAAEKGIPVKDVDVAVVDAALGRNQPLIAPTPVDAALGRNQQLGVNDVYSFNNNPNAAVSINRSNNTSNIDPQYNQPRSQVGKIWAFGNPDYEGKYKPVGNVLSELQGVQHSGTLYQSDAGRWQVIDKRGMLVMSGSPSAPLPKIITDDSGNSQYDSSKWMSINNYVPTAKTPVSATPPASELSTPTGNTLYAGAQTPQTPQTPTSSYDAGYAPRNYGTLDTINPNYNPFSQLFLQQTTLSPKPSVTPPVQKPVYNDDLLGVSWGTSTSLPALTRSPAAEDVSNNNVVVKKIGDYDVYNDGKTIRLRSTGRAVTDIPASGSGSADSSQKLYNLINSGLSYINKYKPHLAGEFGAKSKSSKRKKQINTKPNKVSGFMDVFNTVKKSTPGKLAVNPKNIDISSEVLYTNIWGTRLDKKTPIIKKKVPKETSSGSAWSDVLFNKPKKTNSKKQK